MLTKVVASALLGSALAESSGANPIRRVVTLMQDMQKEIEAEGEKEDDLYKKFKCYCSGNTENLSKAGEDAAAQIEEYNAKVKAEKAEKKQVSEELRQHKTDRTNAKNDLKKATAIRKKEHETYLAEAGDTQANIEATKGAITALEKGMGATAFIQTPLASQLKNVIQSVEGVMDASDKETLVNFLQSTGDYVPASGQIVGILKNMLDEMDKSLGGIVKDEDAAAASFKELKAAKEKEIQLATEAIETKTQRVGELAVSIVQNTQAAKDATSDLEDSQKFLANLAVTCKEKAAEYEERVKIRQEEVAAISEAISVLNDDDALDVFKSSLSKPKVSFLQKGASKRANNIAKAKDMIKKISNKMSPALNLLAHTITQKLTLKVDFTSVIKMIDDMVALLKKEQTDDESHKEYCETELDTADDEKKDVTNKLAGLNSAISEMKDEIASLGEKIAALTAENAALDKSVAEATEQRKEEHSDYTSKIQLNEAAIQLIFKAKNRLQKFYNPDQYVEAPKAEPTEEELNHSFKVSFLQVNKKVSIHEHNANANEKVELEAAPETFEGPYQKKGQKSNSVMALMDMLSKELETEIQEAEHNEKTAQKEYTELLADAQENKAANTKSITDKTKSKADLETKLEDTKTKHIVAADQLENVTGYIADLHQSCDFILANFEVRREARNGEIDSLATAKAVLNGADFK